MSNRERIISLLDNVPDYKMGYILAYVQGITADEEADDAFCQRMIENYENDPDPEKDKTYTLEECKKGSSSRRKRKNLLMDSLRMSGGVLFRQSSSCRTARILKS